MAKLSLKAGSTSKLLRVFILDSSVTTGAGLTGLVYNSSSLTGYYIREGSSSPTAITLATMTVGTWASGGFKEIDSTNMPGVYELGIPDAAIAAGAKSVLVMLKGATGMAPVLLEIELTAVDNQDGTRFGLTALPNGAMAVKKNAALANFAFLMVSSADHATPKTGLGSGITCTRSIDGGAFGSCTNGATELSAGIYVINLSASDLNGTVVTFLFTGTGADARYLTIVTQA